MKIILLIAVIIGFYIIIKEIKKRDAKTSSNIYSNENSSTTKMISPKSKNLQYKRAIEDTFDNSFFFTEEGKFKFPRYKSMKGSLVKIKDVTPYNEMWQSFGSKEKASFTMKDFDLHIEFMIEVEVDEFWDFMKKLNLSNLKPYECVKGQIDKLESLVIEFEEHNEDEPYIYPYSGLEKSLYEKGTLSTYDFQSELELYDYYVEYLSSLRVADLKEISKNAGLRTTLKKQELIDQILERNLVDNIPKPYVKNQNFDEMMKYFYHLYIKDIQKQIDRWHPYYIEAVW
jgi:hypothetical protein